MSHANIEIIDKFFQAYGKRDINALKGVLSPDVRWHFPGRHPFAGVKKGIDGIVQLFDAMGALMGSSDARVEKLIVSANDNHVIEVQRLRTNRADGNNIDQLLCVLWTFSGGRITEGRHFFADQEEADCFFTTIAK
jgi:ketosteroid isomerase-like protein